MMVGIDDQQLGIEDQFLRLPGEPSFVRRLEGTPERHRLIGRRNAYPPV